MINQDAFEVDDLHVIIQLGQLLAYYFELLQGVQRMYLTYDK